MDITKVSDEELVNQLDSINDFLKNLEVNNARMQAKNDELEQEMTALQNNLQKFMKNVPENDEAYKKFLNEYTIALQELQDKIADFNARTIKYKDYCRHNIEKFDSINKEIERRGLTIEDVREIKAGKNREHEFER